MKPPATGGAADPAKGFLPLASVPSAPAPVTDTALPFPAFDSAAPSRQIFGDAGSSEALRILAEANEHIRRTDTLKLLREAIQKFKTGDWANGGDLALQALNIDEKSGEAWHILGVARDKCNDFETAITCYETALRIQPENPAIAGDLGRLSYKMGFTDMAEKFFRFHLEKCPDSLEAVNNLATTLRESSQIDDAIALLQDFLPRFPHDAQLWNALGTVVNARGDNENAALFYRESLKFDPNHVHALYNLGNVIPPEEGLDYLHRALKLFVDPSNIYTCKLSMAFANLSLGRLAEGWTWYEARSWNGAAETMHYVIPRPRWQPGEPVVGKRLFVSTEQGLGDEVLFSNLLPDLLAEMGPDGHLTIATEPRLVPLFQRSFPAATVCRHHTTRYKNLPTRVFPEVNNWDDYDAWSIIGDFLGRYRGSIETFPATDSYLTPDPERVAYWKAMLNSLNNKPKIGLLWKSMIKHARRDRFYSPFAEWETLLRLDGLQFVNLQYGDTSEEMAWAAEAGIDIWTPPGLDLKNDLDDLTALSVALDTIVSPAVATSNIAGAAGASILLILPRGSWTALGTDYFPWYPKTRCVFTDSLVDWAPVMTQVRDALIATHLSDQPDIRRA
ncbi:tetratricopeptide repeat protein [Asticcacaulis sp. EMRT-3]|uniref:tetratricopeptide repeat protein n=1 Tax=Asticcacaulis sp. EMRT-3 TaxID=3040349 RepID=UPI0024AEAA22|nr:tetratricopeptide repeat protein [Asticcacaulis sp. EMRT-3]MDI7774248.1 tetratricopeptide repeat protein [Asticcacaulis sp. EMRT-3]